MKKAVSLAMFAGLFALSAQANYALSQNGKSLLCSADDNQTVAVSAKRNKIKYTVEGESLGYLKVVDVKTDGKTFVSYSTEDYTLTLSDDGDTFMFNDDQEAASIDCD